MDVYILIITHMPINYTTFDIRQVEGGRSKIRKIRASIHINSTMYVAACLCVLAKTTNANNRPAHQRTDGIHHRILWYNTHAYD